MITGVMLAFARVAGETAPLLFTAFGNQFWNLQAESADSRAAAADLYLRHLSVTMNGTGRLGRERWC